MAGELLRRREAEEIVRQYQQGFGRPIISETMNDFRIVAVSKRIFWSKTWFFFTDFLLDFLKDSLGREWATKALADGLEHPVFRWLERLGDFSKNNKDPKTGRIVAAEVGFLTSLFRLGYCLYLIEHNDQSDKKLLRRLQSPELFRPAYYEVIIASAFAVAGSKIRMAEIKGSNDRKPDFWATMPSGRTFGVEAKCKNAWNHDCIPNDAEFRSELRQWLRNMIYQASSKNIDYPIYCFELSIPHAWDESTWLELMAFVREVLVEAEDIKVKGKNPRPAYVVITNNTHLVDDDVPGSPQIAMLLAYLMPDFVSEMSVELELAMELHDQHRDVRHVLECMKEVQRVPQTFDGTPIELLGKDGKSISGLKIGEPTKIEFPNGVILEGVIRDITSSSGTAHIVVEESDGKQSIASLPLTAEEAMAAETYGDAVFGKPQKRNKNLGSDPLALYDWFLEIFQKYSEVELMNQIPSHPDREKISKMTIKEMRIRIAREVTKAAHAATQRPSAKQNSK